MDWNPKQKINGISIQVCLNGYSFKVMDDGVVTESGWLGADRVFTVPEFQRRYGNVEVSLLTPKVALIPASFFEESSARQCLADTVILNKEDEVSHVALPEYAAELVYSLSIGEMLSRTISQAVLDSDGGPAKVLPEMFYILKDLQKIDEYNRIVASYAAGYLHLGISQGRNLLLANVFRAAEFTTAEYFLFMAVRKLQLNPEVSSVYFRTPLAEDEKMSLYRYFKSVERL
ncbi:MAG TPA: hypothetical protein DDX40_06430 [Rikenellaceae bacterium]|nr:hypothetical protein [Rikenellaceae bacterium]